MVAIQNRVLPSRVHSLSKASELAKKRRTGLTAHWLVEDGKLVCQWRPRID